MHPQKRTDTTHGCPLIGKRDEASKQKHFFKRVSAAQATVDTSAPETFPHLTLYGRDYVAKKRAVTEAAFSDLKMIQAITKTMTRTTDMPTRKGPVTLNTDARKQEINRIMKENHRMVQRLESMKPTLSNSELARDERWRQRYVVLCSHSKRKAGEYNKEIDRIRAEDQVDAKKKVAAERRERETIEKKSQSLPVLPNAQRPRRSEGEEDSRSSGNRESTRNPHSASAGSLRGNTAETKAKPSPSSGSKMRQPEQPQEARDVNALLIEAASKLDAAKVQALLAEGADATYIQSAEGVTRTALHAAIEARTKAKSAQDAPGWHTTLKSLLEAKADVNADYGQRDWKGAQTHTSAFEMAMPLAIEDVVVLQAFLTAGADPNAKLVEDINVPNGKGRSTQNILHVAARRGKFEAARALLIAGADPDAVATLHIDHEQGLNKRTSETSLHLACHCRNLHLVALLLAKSADVNAKREDTEHEEVEVDGAKVVRTLQITETPLHIALQLKQLDLTIMLVSAGAALALPRSRGEEELTPADLAGESSDLQKGILYRKELHGKLPTTVQTALKAILPTVRQQQWALPDVELFDAGAADEQVLTYQGIVKKEVGGMWP
mmetsp:Transcript_23665/g.54663  ORF Transcript_23665/g.54663 Transcript_23665/m.54663 type:complete len:609 (-) Transcript_23665:165-1991(-)